MLRLECEMQGAGRPYVQLNIARSEDFYQTQVQCRMLLVRTVHKTSTQNPLTPEVRHRSGQPTQLPMILFHLVENNVI
jgi:hypothetical protein